MSLTDKKRLELITRSLSICATQELIEHLNECRPVKRPTLPTDVRKKEIQACEAHNRKVDKENKAIDEFISELNDVLPERRKIKYIEPYVRVEFKGKALV